MPMSKRRNPFEALVQVAEKHLQASKERLAAAEHAAFPATARSLLPVLRQRDAAHGRG